MKKHQTKRWFTFSGGGVHKKKDREVIAFQTWNGLCNKRRSAGGRRGGKLLKAGCNCRHLPPDHRGEEERALCLNAAESPLNPTQLESLEPAGLEQFCRGSLHRLQHPPTSEAAEQQNNLQKWSTHRPTIGPTLLCESAKQRVTSSGPFRALHDSLKQNFNEITPYVIY